MSLYGVEMIKASLLSSHVYTFVTKCQEASLGDVRNAQSMSNIIEAFSIACQETSSKGY